MTNLFRACSNLAERPPDQRFWTLQELHDATLRNREKAATATIRLQDVRVEAQDSDLKLVGKSGVTAAFTHWSFGQLARIAQAPASYLRELPPTLAAQNINYGLKARGNGTESKRVLHREQTPAAGLPTPDARRPTFRRRRSASRAAVVETPRLLAPRTRSAFRS